MLKSLLLQMKEYNLKQLTPSPNGILRGELDGTIFRSPIFVKNIACNVKSWEQPIVLGRHGYGDVYKNCEIKTPCGGKAELVFTGADGKEIRKTIQVMKGPGIIQGIHNLDKSIESFAHCCFKYALDKKISVWFGTKDTISKIVESSTEKTKEIDKGNLEAMLRSIEGSDGGENFIEKEIKKLEK